MEQQLASHGLGVWVSLGKLRTGSRGSVWGVWSGLVVVWQGVWGEEQPLTSHIQRSNKISRNALGFDEERFREQFSTHIFPPNGRQ